MFEATLVEIFPFFRMISSSKSSQNRSAYTQNTLQCKIFQIAPIFWSKNCFKKVEAFDTNVTLPGNFTKILEMDFGGVLIPQTHYKLSISDILNSTCDADNNFFTCKVQSKDEISNINYQNVRIAGLCIDHTVGGFKLDDGSGIIKLMFATMDSNTEPPNIGDYVEVLGQCMAQVPPFIKIECFSVKNDPMEEVKHLLEQAALHKDYFKFQFLGDDSYLSAQTSQTNEITKLANQALDFMKNRNGTKDEEIIEFCHGEDNYRQVINYLTNNTLIYENDGLWYSI